MAVDCSSLPDGTACDDGNACTQTDTCQGGVCTGASPIVCMPIDQCHLQGTCNTATGVCSNPNRANGTACSDGNACTQVDTCQAGTCSSGSAVVCSAQDQCHDAGTCNPMTGVCSNPTSPDGTACADGDACTQVDTCQSGACTGTNPVVCTASDQCHDAGTCEPSTGDCSNPARTDLTPCNDGDACTQTDYCESGVCQGSALVDCTVVGPCFAPGTCNPSTGLCTNPPLPPGFPCNDGDACTIIDTCNSGICTGIPKTCGPIDDCHTAGTCDAMTGECSNPVVADHTPCDDGNACTGPDHCKMGSCVADPLVCPDVSPCADEHCEAGLGCVATPAPAPSCLGSLSSKLGYAAGDDSSKDKLKWTWSKGAQATADDLGNPTLAVGYDLCVFAVTDADTTVLLDATLPAGSGWADLNGKGYKFGDKGAVSGVSKAQLKAGEAGKSKVGVSGKGANLDDGVLPLDADLQSILVQLSGGNHDLCFESEFAAADIVVKGSKLSAKAGPALSVLCSNGEKDGDESDVDCGGRCDVCTDGSDCAVGTDCLSGVCNVGICTMTCVEGTADCDLVANNGCEIDTTSDGNHCGACLAACDVSETCNSSVCTSSGPCSNGFQDGNETDKDCGGGTCAPCGAYQYCSVGSDCMSGSCPIGKCDP